MDKETAQAAFELLDSAQVRGSAWEFVRKMNRVAQALREAAAEGPRAAPQEPPDGK